MIKYLEGNCIDKMKELEDNSIDCVVSSPPYFGLRDYGVDGQFGLEKTYQDYLANTVKVFETFKPKLKDTATIWWNVGDSYNQNQSAGDRVSKYSKKQKTNQGNLGFKIESQKNLKVKDLLMIPNRVAIALQDAGWYIRSEIIWHKPNPMPESVRDRPTSSHEKIWLITKNKKYYYDADAIKEPQKLISIQRAGRDTWNSKIGAGKWSMKLAAHKQLDKKVFDTYKSGKIPMRNKRNVWTVSTKPFKEAHFATFPKGLIEPCIKAGCPEGGIVLDPFAGAGTTGLVAKENNRDAILIELNKEYLAMAKKRIETVLV